MTVNVSPVDQRTSPPPPFPRPVTEIERARTRAEARVEEELAAAIERAHENWRRQQELNPTDGGDAP